MTKMPAIPARSVVGVWRVFALVGVLLVVGASARAQGPAQEPAQRRTQGAAAGVAGRGNVVLIVADDLGYADVGAQGISKDVRTPNIDSIAANGVRFPNGYVSAPVCSPTRAGLLTGKYQQRFGFEANPRNGADERFGLPVEQVTLADEMKRGGYATGMTGKWHLGSRPEMWPLKRGFDEFYGFLGGAHGYNGTRPVAAQGSNAIRRGEKPVEEKEYLTEAITREAVSFVERHQGEPFFLYVPYNAVHTPQQAPAKYVEPFAGVKDEKRRMMLAMLSALDEGVGQILAKLRAAGLEEKTLVVFVSDNGGPTGGNGSRNTPLRGIKGEVWEGGIRVPFMMQWKGRIPAGQVVEHPVISLDLFPTALAAAGIGLREGSRIDGVNLLPWVEGKQDAKGEGRPAGRPHEVLYWRFRPQWAVREGDYKLVKPREGGPFLFDVAEDPGETRDLAKERPEVVERLKGKFEAWNGELTEPRWPGRQEGGRGARGEAEEKEE